MKISFLKISYLKTAKLIYKFHFSNLTEAFKQRESQYTSAVFDSFVTDDII